MPQKVIRVAKKRNGPWKSYEGLNHNKLQILTKINFFMLINFDFSVIVLKNDVDFLRLVR